jgi:hypothetical protein
MPWLPSIGKAASKTPVFETKTFCRKSTTMLKNQGSVAYSNLPAEKPEAAERELFPFCITQNLIANNLYGDGHVYRVRVFLWVRDPRTGRVHGWGWYRFGFLHRGEKVIAHWGQAFRHEVVAFQFYWRSASGANCRTARYEAQDGYFYANLGISWGSAGDYFPILDESPLCRESDGDSNAEN